MMMVRKRLPILVVMFCVVTGLAVPAGAEKVNIEGRKHAVDTFYGVPAYYDEIATIATTKWQCTEYVRRFYRDAYGLDINSIFIPIMLTQGYELRLTKTPKPGDIFHSPALRRGKTTDHTAIVKAVGDGYVTLIEQNHRYKGYASVNRVVAIPDRAVDFYTPVGVGQADPQLSSKGNAPQRDSVGLQDLLGIDLFGNRQATNAQTVPSTQATEPETTTQPTTVTATADALVEEFILKEMAQAAAVQQDTTAQIAREEENSGRKAAALGAPGTVEPVRKMTAPALAMLFIALLAICGTGGVFLLKKDWCRRCLHAIRKRINR